MYVNLAQITWLGYTVYECCLKSKALYCPSTHLPSLSLSLPYLPVSFLTSFFLSYLNKLLCEHSNNYDRDNSAADWFECSFRIWIRSFLRNVRKSLVLINFMWRQWEIGVNLLFLCVLWIVIHVFDQMFIFYVTYNWWKVIYFLHFIKWLVNLYNDFRMKHEKLVSKCIIFECNISSRSWLNQCYIARFFD